MTRLRRRPRTAPIGRRPSCEGLEARLVLSAVIATGPAGGEALHQSPQALTVTFDQPLDPTSIGFGDILLDRVADDGSLTPVLDPNNPPTESLDDPGTTLTVPLDGALAPGHYRILLAGWSGLASIDGEQPIASPDGSDSPLGDFTIDPPGVGTADATDLGIVGPSPRDVPASLDLAADPSAIALYRITLDSGHFWRLGLSVGAADPGSNLRTTLALFDASGRPIAASSLGLPNDPSDPVLFHGLAPGTYFVGVSGSGNVPGQPGGYNIATVQAGSAPSQPGGAFTLHLVADPADLPAEVTGLTLDRDDPLDPTPTLMVVSFSAAINLGITGDSAFQTATEGVELVDPSGRSWPLAAVGYNPDNASIWYLFRDRLPAGSYTLELNPDHPLTDLAGHAPFAAGQAPGVLGTFTVAVDARPRLADGSFPFTPPPTASTAPAPIAEDLGPLTPDLVLAGSFSRSVHLEPGQTFFVRFVNLYQDFYKLGVGHDGGPVSIDLDGPDDLPRVIDAGPSGATNTSLLNLSEGEYVASFTATGTTAVDLTIRITIASFSWDSLLAVGLGQGPALNLRLVNPSLPGDPIAVAPGPASSPSPAARGEAVPPSTPPGATVPGPTGPLAGPVAASMAAILTGTTAAVPAPSVVLIPHQPAPTAEAMGPAGLFLGVGGELVGRVGAGADHVAPVGPTNDAGALALAVASTGQGQSVASGIILRPTFDLDGPKPASPSTDGGMVPAEANPNPEVSADSGVLPATFDNPAHVASLIASPAPVASAEEAAMNPPLADLGDEPESEAAPTPSPWRIAMAGALALGAWSIARRRRARPRLARPRPQRTPAPHRPRRSPEMAESV